MVSSQNNNSEDGLEELSEHEDDQGEIDLCRIFQGERVETALQKTLAAYETLSQKECQEILDCSEETKEEQANKRYLKQIPQYDGACDEEPFKTEDEENVNAKRRKWGTLPISIKESPTKSTQEGGTPRTPEYSSGSPRYIRESRSSSIRDLMRVKRARRKLEAENDTDSPESSGKNTFNFRRQYGALPLVNNQFQVNGMCQAIEDPQDILVLDAKDNRKEDPSDILIEENEASRKSLDAAFDNEPKTTKDCKLKNGEISMVFHRRPPSKHEVLSTFKEHGLQPVKYPVASYGASGDVSDGIMVRGDPPAGIPTEFDNGGNILYLLSPARSPPSLSSVQKWLTDNQGTLVQQSKQVDQSITPIARPASPKYDEMHALSIERSPSVSEHKTPSSSQQSGSSSKRWSREFSQITGVSLKQSTPASQTGFRDSSASSTGQQLTLMSIEVLAETRCNLRPDPQHDQISCIAIAIQGDNTLSESRECIVLLHDKSSQNQTRLKDGISGTEVIHFADEMSLLHFFIRLVRVYDPDILLGWEIQRLSLGFLAERSATLGLGLLTRISRTPPKESLTSAFLNDDQNRVGIVPEISKSIIEDEWGRTHGSGIYVGGRTVLNLWRIMRGEVKLGNYTLECVAEAVLKRKVPRISWRDLTGWFKCKFRFRAIEYFINRATLNLQIIDQLDLVNRTAELARVFGIDFYSVLSRGSQYRVESMMLRLAHSQNFLAISPSKEQVAGQPAMECLPLVMEPESKFYTSPVVVLDFQSLYPSMIIAYNLCFSTCLGKCTPLNPKILGVASLWLQPEVLRGLLDKLIVSPNGVMFAPPEIAPGVLPRLLFEILSTRIMIKNEMKKLLPSQKVLHRILNARQFALKLIANVTYGYAAAGFSGRMPCAELADSIVQLGRHTLEQAIDMVNNNSSWDARVVYGDTDSMFVLLEGRTREEAFKIGQEIAAAVTAANPEPVTLKMEKVYHPCVLLTKKRYVGYSYESPAQEVPTFDAKGIETVRRDSCGAVSKTMEKSLRLLFETCDLLKVKQYLQRQWQKIIGGRISIQDFIFSKEVRLGTYSTRASVLPPAAIVATKAMQSDPRAEPCYGERIQYVVVHGKPGSRLVDMVFDPYELLDDTKGLRLHDTYYINKQIIPALQRVFWLLGVDLKAWLNEMPRVYQVPASKRPRQGYEASDGDENNEYSRRGRIDHYYASKHCVVCGEIIQGGRYVVCGECFSNHRLLHVVLGGRASRLEKEYQHIQAICMHCGGGEPGGQIRCISLDCTVYFERIKLKRELENCLSLLHRLAI